MKERPILFSGPMVRAILDGRKTQTRRVVKPQPVGRQRVIEGLAHVTRGMNPADDGAVWYVGDCISSGVEIRCPFGSPGDRLWVKETWCRGRAFVFYRADCGGDPPSEYTDDWNAPLVDRWRPSIHMPRSASRLTLEVVSVRVERLADISEADAKAEGYASASEFLGAPWACSVGPNPWVWVVEFKRVEGGAG